MADDNDQAPQAPANIETTRSGGDDPPPSAPENGTTTHGGGSESHTA
jgi:hypothetical protein